MNQTEHSQASTNEVTEDDIPPQPEPIRPVQREAWQKESFPLDALNVINKADQGFRSWMNQLAEEMNTDDMRLVYHALRGVMFTLRDRLTPAEVFDLSSQMPVLIRGIFFEGYNPRNKPEKLNAEAFTKRVKSELQDRDDIPIDRIIRSVMRVLYRNISKGEYQDIIDQMPKSLRVLLFGRNLV